MKVRRKQGFFSISAVAKMFSVHQQTIRLYEKQGLIAPKRSDGNTRLFSEDDIDRLEEIIYLTHELGINLAGVEVIFKLKRQIKKMQNDMNKIFEKTQKDLDEQTEQSQQIVQKNVQRWMSLQNRKDTINPAIATLPLNNPEQTEENWEVDYEE